MTPTKKESPRSTKQKKNLISMAVALVVGVVGVFAVTYFALPSLLSVTYSEGTANSTATSSIFSSTTTPSIKIPPLDTAAYDAKLLALTHVATSSAWYLAFMSSTTTVTLPGTTTPTKVTTKSWPVRAPYPSDSRALLPFNRIVAYYGNFYAKGMGVLGQYPVPQMLQKLASTTAMWQAADPSTPVIPAIDYITVVAQGSAGADGKYRARMPDSQMDEAVQLANQIHGIVVLDVQVGLSNVQTEVPLLEKYLKMPNVELAVDPEFAMHNGAKPGTVIGSLDATDINFAAQYLAKLVRDNNLPPKILLVHRFTEAMVTHYKNIQPLPEVQVVMDMDGWGTQAKKIGTYTNIVAAEPVQFTGFKLFYKNDLLKPSTGMMSQSQVLGLTPAPVFIQYQ
jgi:hypothetical protein